MRLPRDPSSFPAVEDVGEAEQSSHHARFGVLGRASEQVVVIEIEVDDFAVAVDCDAGDVVPKIAIPVDARYGRVRVLNHVAAIALRWLNGPVRLNWFDLCGAQRIRSERTAFIAVPEAGDQLHQKMAINPVSLLHCFLL